MIPYTAELADRMRSHLAAHTRHHEPLEGRRHAAVAMVVVDSEAPSQHEDPWAGGASFLLCRRASRLNAHASQWALPGGRLDPGESPEQAALRELDEELGVSLPHSAVLGLLDDYPTRSGYVITPVVLWGGGPLDLRPSPDEVMAAYRVGLHHLRRPDSPRFVTIPESNRPVVQVPLGDQLVHAPTGAVLVQFRWVALDGEVNARVHEFEQPVFAWR